MNRLEDIVIDNRLLRCNLNIPRFNVKQGKKTRKYLNCSFSIDIETTSTIDNGLEIAFPYCYQVGINNAAYITRDYRCFYAFLDNLNEYLNKNNVYIHCLIHNLPYEFTFFSGFVSFHDVFAKQNGKALVAEYGNIRFLDSCAISGFSLEKLSHNFTKTKKIKDINYKLYRVPETELTAQEIRYCEDDVIILNEYWDSKEIQRYIKKQGYSKIPITSTSKVRLRVKEHIPVNIIPKLSALLYDIFPSTTTWELLNYAFMGGVVKSNPQFTNVLLHDVGCVDLTSSYPASMFKYLYPMSRFLECKLKSVKDIESKYCYLIKAHISNLKSKIPFRTLSYSKVFNVVNPVIDNGRLISADSLDLIMTDVDFKYMFEFYQFDYEILYAERSIKGRLPKYLINTLHELYVLKDKLKAQLTNDKHNQDLKADYQHSKGMLNGLYGMCVTADKRVNYKYENGVWKDTINTKYHTFNRKSFLAYQWGVWISAYSRAALYDGVLMVSDTDNGYSDIVYSDTDSCKFLNYKEHLHKYKEWNVNNDKLVRSACAHYGIDYKDMEGLGRWDFEGVVKDFKTLGSKRYYHDGEVTISGIKSENFCKYAESIGMSALDLFNDKAKIPPEHTGKNTSKYFLNRTKPYYYRYTYNGVKHEIPIYNYIYMQEAPWQMTLSKDYKELLFIVHSRLKELEELK